ncbi:glutaredoxin family protein [Aidingimonas halophila]|uniref:Glutaredoxin n=1 Tax=Aidingimonas halophila TaxID=574349 RepID=A0A1H3E9L8_9GAMM|nr:glutathione S-transferase N-terminal domain-containing protein [Aidingimonas halophila]GHC33965.1 hypothetical protein GCM10008094_28600 [Aidingimonas halophila]SDX74614.1 Glutaredoxin [Aidingimonas halophila]
MSSRSQRIVGKILAPVIWVADTLGTSREVQRDDASQAEVERACRQLILYQFMSCPFCIKVRREMTRLDLPIEVRDARLDPEHRQALKAGGGRIQVPCLHITHDDGREEWLYESDDIIAYLRRRFG